MSDATWRRTLLRTLAFLSVLAVPAAALALVSTLPRAPATERIASAALAEVQKAYSVRSVETLPGQTLGVTCRTLSNTRSLIAFSNGVRLRYVGRHVVPFYSWRLPPHLRRSLKREAMLASCPNTVSLLLGRRLARSFWRLGSAFLHLRAHGDNLYVIRLRGGHPLIELELRRANLEPVGVVLRDGRLNASSRVIAEESRSPQRRKPA